MGLDYSYDLFFERAQLWDVLQAVSELAQVQPDRQTIIVFPDHELVLPLREYSEKNGRIAFDDPMRRRHFSGSLYFEVDEAIQQYVEEWQADVREDRGDLDWKPPFDEQGRVAIGDISLLHLAGFECQQPQGLRSQSG